MICTLPLPFRCLTLVLIATLFSSADIAHAEVSDAEKIRRDLAVLVHGDWNEQQAAVDRLFQHGPAAVPAVAALLSSEEAVARGRAAQTLWQFPAEEAAAVLPQLLEALRVESDGWALGCIAEASAVIAEESSTVTEILLTRIEQGDTVGPACAQSFYELDLDLTGAKPILLEALSAEWADNKCYLFWTLDRKIGLTEEDLDALARCELGPKPEYWERPGDRPGQIEDNYSEVRDWEYVVRPLSERLRSNPEAYLTFLRNHPGALSVYRENEPWLIYLFAEMSEETQALRDYLVTREDLPGMFEIDLAAGEQVGVLESYPTSGNACFPQAELISVVVRDGICDVADAPVPEGYGIEFGSGLAVINIDGLFGYIDESGVIQISPRFEFAARFREGRALVRQDGLMGMISSTGAFIVEPRFEEVMGFYGRLWRVSENGLYGLMHDNGAMYVEAVYQKLGLDADVNITATTADGTTGMIDAEGNFIPDAE